MPKFFLPAYDEGDPLIEETYEGIRKFAGGEWDVLPDRIFRIEWVHDGREYATEVGMPEPYEHELTVAIFRSNAYLVCTPNRAVIRGGPILVGLNEIRRVVLFDDSPEAPKPTLIR